MAIAELSQQSSTKTLKDRKLKEQLQHLRVTDNYTNLYYIIRTWLFLGFVIGGTLWFYHTVEAQGWSFWWNVPVTFLAIICVGAGQHQLSGLAHEGAHHILFKHRIWNDLASDWFCMFPMFSTTHHYRLQHLAHHQFVNDPVRDPDVSQLQTSGHWLTFPVLKKAFINTLLKQLWIPRLIRFMRVRAAYNTVGTQNNPYLKKGWTPKKGPVRVGILYLLGQIGTLTALVMHGNPLLLAIIPAAMLVIVLTYYILIPEDHYHQSRIHPTIHPRWMTVMRMVFSTILFNSLAWITFLTGHWAAMYFALLWIVPLFTSFSFFMILRQLVQHGNGDRGLLTNTRVFFVNRCINFCVFPMGQDYHLPHHMYSTIPHYRLKELHQLLMNYPEYQNQVTVVEGYFVPSHQPPTAPTVLDVLGPEYAPKEFHEVYIDNDVLTFDKVEDRELIEQEAKDEAERLRNENIN